MEKWHQSICWSNLWEMMVRIARGGKLTFSFVAVKRSGGNIVMQRGNFLGTEKLVTNYILIN